MLIRSETIQILNIGGTDEILKKVQAESNLAFNIENIQKIRNELKISGWAVDLKFNLPPISILAYSENEIVAQNEVFVSRRDVERATNCEIDLLGFQIALDENLISASAGKFDLVAILHDRKFCQFYSC